MSFSIEKEIVFYVMKSYFFINFEQNYKDDYFENLETDLRRD